MEIRDRNFRKGFVRVRTQNMDDLWYLSQIIESADLVRATAERKIKIGDGDNQKVTKKIATITLSVDKLELTENLLRISGLIQDGPEDFPRGVHQAVNITTSTDLTITKKEWLKYQQNKIQEAANAVPMSIIAVIFDREEALFYAIGNQGYEQLTKIKGDVAKKDQDNTATGNFYKDIVKLMQSYDNNSKPQSFIIASPAFWKEYLLKEMPDELKQKTISATCSEVSPRAIAELIKRPELQKTLDRSKSFGESETVAELLEAVAKDKAAYGVGNVTQAVHEGSVKTIMLTTTFIHDQREADTFNHIESLLKTAEQQNGKVHIISTQEPQKKLDALSGIAAIKRW